MKKSFFGMLAAILFCSLTTTVLTSCGGSDSDQPVYSGTYVVKAVRTKFVVPQGTGGLAQLCSKYDAELQKVYESVYSWGVTATEGTLNKVLEQYDILSKAQFNKMVADLELIKQKFEAEDKTELTGYMIIEITVSADQTVTGRKVVEDKKITLEYENLTE